MGDRWADPNLTLFSPDRLILSPRVPADVSRSGLRTCGIERAVKGVHLAPGFFVVRVPVFDEGLGGDRAIERAYRVVFADLPDERLQDLQQAMPGR